MDFGRLITAMVTPFDENLQIDWKRLEELVEYLIVKQRNDGLVVSGTTGESPTLSDEEKIKLFKEVVRIADGRAKVIAGTGSYDTEHSIHLTREAEKTGVDGILLVAPYYSRPSQDGLYAHFKAIAEATKLPVMLYNIPSRAGVNIEASTTLRLAKIPNIVATKEAHGDLDLITELAIQAPDSFRIYCGDDSVTLPYLSVGAYGIVSVAAHVVGSEMKDMVEAFISGNVSGAVRLHHKLFPVFKGSFYCPHRVPSPAPIKHALKLHGVDVGGLRLPLVPVTEEEGRFIQALFK